MQDKLYDYRAECCNFGEHGQPSMVNIGFQNNGVQTLGLTLMALSTLLHISTPLEYKYLKN